MSKPIASSVLWAKTFSFPRYRYLLKFISSLTFAKDPSACMLRFILSCVPYSLVILSRHSARFSSSFLETESFLFLSLRGVLQLFPLIHAFLYGQRRQLSHSYIVTSLRYPVAVFSVFFDTAFRIFPFLHLF